MIGGITSVFAGASVAAFVVAFSRFMLRRGIFWKHVRRDVIVDNR